MNPAATPNQPGQPIAFRARAALLKRMADVVCLPSSRVNAFERSMTADLLVDMLREAEPEDRLKVARRLANLSEIPASLVRLLLRDHVEIAEALLTNCASLTDSDLLAAKLVEEAGELSEARDAASAACEAADLVYFTAVALARAGVAFADVERELDRRALRVTRRPGDAKPPAEGRRR